jgi:adenylate cyclase
MQISNNKEKSGQSRKLLRLPLFLKVSIVVCLLACLLIGVCGRFFWEQHGNALLSEKLLSAEHILIFFASSAKVPLLTDDTLRLSSVVRDVVDLEGIVYASVLDRNQVVQAGLGVDDFEGKKSLPESGEVLSKKNGTVIVQYTHPLLGQVFDLSRVIAYRDKPLGTVRLGVSGKFIEENLAVAGSALLRSFLWPSLSIMLVLLFMVSLYTRQVNRRTSSLIQAADQYGNGNLHYRVAKIENNEWGEVVRALHNMSQKLLFQPPSQVKLEQYLKFSSLDRLLENPISQEDPYAFRRPVAVLFASIKGFGSYAGTEQPENIVKALNRYISIVTRVISKHGGYVDKVIGDSVVGIFGVSLYRKNHTGRAIRAALDLQEALAVGNKNESRLLSNVCVGISSGVVLSGNIGSYSKVEYSSIGESIKEAYWLSNLGHPGEIILGEDVHSSIKDSIKAEALPPQNVLGGADIIKSYRLLSLTENENE